MSVCPLLPEAGTDEWWEELSVPCPEVGTDEWWEELSVPCGVELDCTEAVAARNDNEGGAVPPSAVDPSGYMHDCEEDEGVIASDSPNYFAQRQAAADYCHVPLNPVRRRDRHRCILLLVLLQRKKTLQLELQIQGLGK